MLEPVLPALELPQVAVLGDQRGAQRPDLPRALPLGQRHEPLQHRAVHSGVNRGRSLSISPIATAALRTGTRAARTASRSTPLHSLAIASVTPTSAAAPPAR